MATAPISYGSDYNADQAAIERSRKYAELMQQQGMQPIEQQTAGGWVIPVSPFQGLAKAVQSGAGAYLQGLADKKEKALAAKYQSDLADVIKRGTAAQSGTPERTFQTPANEMGDEAATQRIAATPADPSAAAGIYMSHPATQALGMQLAQQNAQRQQWAQLLGGGQGSPGAAPQGAAPAGGGSPMGGAPAAPQAGGMLAGTGITPQDAQAALLADPTGKLLTEKVLAARAENQKPILQREGDVLRRNPDGSVTSIFSSPKMEPGMQPVRGPNGQVMGAQPIPGYAPGISAQKGMEAGAVSSAQAQNKMVTVQTPQGPRMMTEAQAAQLAGNGPALPQQGVQPSQQMAGLPPNVAAAIQADMAKSGTQNANFRIGPTDAPAGAPVAPQNIQSGAIGPQQMRPQAPAGPGIPLQTDEQKAYGQARAKDFATQAAGMADQGNKAASMSRQLSELERLYQDPNIAKGAAAESISGLKNLASSFGVDIKGIGGEQAVQAITNKMALDLRSTGEGGGMPGAMSDADRNFLANMTPNLSKSPEGRKEIIATTRKMAQRQMDIARMATAYEQKNGQIDVGFQKELQDFANANPLFSSNATGVPQLSPEAQAIIKKYRGG